MLKILFFIPVFLFSYLIKLDNKCFTEWYDTDLRIPILAEFNLTKNEILAHNLIRITYFKQDKRIPKEYRTKQSDLAHSGLDKGHLVANDFVNYNKGCQIYSFLMSNITPQYPRFNRNIWRKIENKIKSLAIKYENIKVIIGNFGSLGKINNINIPKYYFAIILTKNQIFYIIISQDGKTYKINKLLEYPLYDKISLEIIKNYSKELQ